jgi:hypothetical protein
LLEILREEIELAMAFSGCATVSDIDASVVRLRSLPSPAAGGEQPAEREADAIEQVLQSQDGESVGLLPS